MAKLAAAIPALTGIGSVLGPVASIIGAAQSLGVGSSKKKSPAPPVAAQEPAFSPKKPSAVQRPGSLSSYNDFSPEQERSSLATKGLNQGLGGDEDAYYRNLVSRSLIGDDNSVTGDSNSLLPVESQYFSSKGYDTSNVTNLLKAIMGG